jgi:hypothetical protein
MNAAKHVIRAQSQKAQALPAVMIGSAPFASMKCSSCGGLEPQATPIMVQIWKRRQRRRRPDRTTGFTPGAILDSAIMELDNDPRWVMI